MRKMAIGIIDAQRGFMPQPEDERLSGVAGFGELPVAGAEKIIPNINRLVAAAPSVSVFTTQDFHHPDENIHFSQEPNFKTTWPTHCVADTPGAELHPDIKLPENTKKFYKGTQALEPGQPDTSYSGFYAETPESQKLINWLNEQGISVVILVGIALSHCVGSTALDLANAGLEVTIARDATVSVSPETEAEMLAKLTTAGVHISSTDEAIDSLSQAD